MKENSLFCFVVVRSTKQGCFRSCSWCLWKALDEEGCMGLVPWWLDLWCKSCWILSFLSLKNKLNHSWKFWRNWTVPLVPLERSWWARFNGIYLVRFGFKMWEILILKWFNFQRNWTVPMVLSERSWWARFSGIYLVRFGFKMWEILILKWFLLLKIQINSKNPSFGRRNQLMTR